MQISPGDLIEPLYVLGILPRKAGKSAYQIWLDQGNTGSVQDFLDSLKGADGKSAYQVWLDNGNIGTEEQFLMSLIGPRGPAGDDGKSTYQSWLDEGNVGTEADFLASLIGPMGPVGGAFVQDNFVATDTVIDARFVMLSAVPADPLKVSLVIFGGIEQKPGVDFTVSGQTLGWDSLALQSLLEKDNTFVVRYLPSS